MALDLTAAALSLAAEGMPVFPCRWIGRERKQPLTQHGFRDASLDSHQIRAWWRRWPEALIGMPTGPASGRAVIDIDPQGIPWLHAKFHKRSLPETRTHQTPRGGFHLIYRCPDPPIHNTASKLAAGVDTRGDGGYIIVPPSPGYEICDDSDLAPFPKWIAVALLREPRRPVFRREPGVFAPDALARFVIASQEGARNCRLFWAACRAGEVGAAADARQRLIEAALRCGLSLVEAEKTVASGLTRGQLDGPRAT